MTELNVLKRDSNDNLDTLRATGQTPGVCYGGDFENTPISFNQREFRKMYRDAGSSSVIDLGGDLKGEKCFVHDMQVHVVTEEILHVDFKIVAAGQKTEVAVHVETEGEAPAVAKRLGLLTLAHNELTVEAVPSKIPSSIIVDVTGLVAVGDNIKVSDLKLEDGVSILDNADTTVVSISALQEEKEIEEEAISLEDVLADPNADEEASASEEKKEETAAAE